ncbi:glycine radical domain-containing protein [uncultured Desulfobacter sp.]|uniref:glycine radical domain-containing protein n=1 Tax=uncultured Desulfobacter sp. TaxID=240139 RepID=UPI0029F5787D|nr:glycine radical domain-containing protein [uncultured Desulfobacter sp.]
MIKSLSKMDQARSGGTLLNHRFLPSILATDKDLKKLTARIRTYFGLGGHHIQFNVMDTKTLRAGYSDYFVDLDKDHQEEIISRTAQQMHYTT